MPLVRLRYVRLGLFCLAYLFFLPLKTMEPTPAREETDSTQLILTMHYDTQTWQRRIKKDKEYARRCAQLIASHISQFDISYVRHILQRQPRASVDILAPAIVQYIDYIPGDLSGIGEVYKILMQYSSATLRKEVAQLAGKHIDCMSTSQISRVLHTMDIHEIHLFFRHAACHIGHNTLQDEQTLGLQKLRTMLHISPEGAYPLAQKALTCVPHVCPATYLQLIKRQPDTATMLAPAISFHIEQLDHQFRDTLITQLLYCVSGNVRTSLLNALGHNLKTLQSRELNTICYALDQQEDETYLIYYALSAFPFLSIDKIVCLLRQFPKTSDRIGLYLSYYLNEIASHYADKHLCNWYRSTIDRFPSLAARLSQSIQHHVGTTSSPNTFSPLAVTYPDIVAMCPQACEQQNDMTPSKRHFIRYAYQIRGRLAMMFAYDKLKHLMQACLHREQTETSSGRFVAYHARKWGWHFYAFLYHKLWSLVHETSCNHYQFIRFLDMYSADQQSIAPCIGTHSSDGYLFANPALFSNTTSLGSCAIHYLLTNSNDRRNVINVTIPDLLDSLNLPQDMYVTYQEQLDQLYHEHQAIQPYGELLMLSLTREQLRRCARLPQPFPASMHVNGKDIHNIDEILDTFTQTPDHLEDYYDNIELTFPLTAHRYGLLDPVNGPRIYSFHAGDSDEAYHAWKQKAHNLLEHIYREHKERTATHHNA